MHLPMSTDPRAQVIVRQRSMWRFNIAVVVVVIAVAAATVAGIAVVAVVIVATGREKPVGS